MASELYAEAQQEANSPPGLFRLFAALPAAEWRTLGLLLLLALLNGLFFLAIIPPWQHYDEPTHFEYAWLIANRPTMPQEMDVDPQLRREVADSMYQYRFYEAGVAPDLFAVDSPILGANQRVHPPLYYMLAAVPLRLTAGLAIDVQLYTVRFLSLGFYVLSVLAAWRLTSAIVPDEPLIQLTIPLLLIFTPTFTDMMTSVNNDVLVNFSAIVFFLGCMWLIRDGWNSTAFLLATLALLVGLFTKRTFFILLIPYAITIFWMFRRTAMPHWISLAVLISLVTLGAFACFSQAITPEGHRILISRPWLSDFDRAYLRLDLDSWLSSLSNIDRSSEVYALLAQIGFTSFWLRFGWGNIGVPLWADLAMAAFCGLCFLGLLVARFRGWSQWELWQRRCIQLLAIAVILGVLSMVARVHPLPITDVATYIPRGRYIFTVMLPVLWLTLLGWQNLWPVRFQPYTPIGLLSIWLGINLSTSLWVIVQAFYPLA